MSDIFVSLSWIPRARRSVIIGQTAFTGFSIKLSCSFRNCIRGLLTLMKTAILTINIERNWIVYVCISFPSILVCVCFLAHLAFYVLWRTIARAFFFRLSQELVMCSFHIPFYTFIFKTRVKLHRGLEIRMTLDPVWTFIYFFCDKQFKSSVTISLYVTTNIFPA